MIKNITGALGRPFGKNRSQQLPNSAKHVFSMANGALTAQELRLLVASMVD